MEDMEDLSKKELKQIREIILTVLHRVDKETHKKTQKFKKKGKIKKKSTISNTLLIHVRNTKVLKQGGSYVDWSIYVKEGNN